MRRAANIKDRIKANVTSTPNGCWLWMRRKDRQGYGRITVNGRPSLAHRVSYLAHKGEIPSGLCLDHLCRNRACLNPAHLQPVSFKENTLRGASFSAVNARKRTCIHGHPFTEDNTYLQGGRRRQCRRCNAGAVSRYKARKVTQRADAARPSNESSEAS